MSQEPEKNKNPSSIRERIFSIRDLQRALEETFQGRSTLQNALYLEREKNINAFFQNVSNASCLPSEKTFIHELIETVNQLLGVLKDGERRTRALKQKNLCEKIFRLIYSYINYRLRGISHHLQHDAFAGYYRRDNNSPLSLYASPYWGDIYIQTTFKEHEELRRKEISAYLKTPLLGNMLAFLEGHLPLIFKEAQTLETFLADGKNPCSDPGVKFDAPPFLSELNTLLLTVGKIHKNDISPQVLDELNKNLLEVRSYIAYYSIQELLCKIYTPIECLAFFPDFPSLMDNNSRLLRLCLAIGLNFSNIIPYSLLELTEGNIKQARNILKKSSSSAQEKIQAGKILRYAPIPWMTIRNISALLFKATQEKRPADEALIFEASRELGPSWKNILSALENLIVYEAAVAAGEVNFDTVEYIPLQPADYQHLESLSCYSADALFLNKLINTLQSLDFNKPFLAETHLRLLGILGECSKNLSPLIKKLMGERYWKSVGQIRDKTAHTTGFLRRLQKLLVSEKHLEQGLRSDLRTLLPIAIAIKTNLPATWSQIKVFYKQDANELPEAANLGEGLNNLLGSLEKVLSQQDLKELRDTKNLAPADTEEKRDKVLTVLLKTKPAQDFDRNDFFSFIDGLRSLTAKQKKQIQELYKKLRQDESTPIPDAIIKAVQEIKLIDISRRIEALIEKLKSYMKPETLEKELNAIGLEKATPTWEEKRKKCEKKYKEKAEKKKVNPSPQAWNLDKVLRDSIESAKKILRHLEELYHLTHTLNSKEIMPLEQFWHDPILYHAVEFHFIRLRVYMGTIQEALSYLLTYSSDQALFIILNSLHKTLSTRLESIRLYANELAHLHDVTEFDTRTAFGHKHTAYQEVWNAIKDHRAWTSLRNDLLSFIKNLEEKLTKEENDKVQKLQENRKKYHLKIKLQQLFLAKLPVKYPDYQILSQFSKIPIEDPDKKIKDNLYDITIELFELHQEFIELQHSVVIPKNTSAPASEKKHAKIEAQELFFEEVEARGDGWCTLNAAGIPDPAAALDNLRHNLGDPIIVNFLRQAIQNNFYANIELGEEFEIAGNDNEGNNIAQRLEVLYLNCENASEEDRDEAYAQMISYLEKVEVLQAYLDYLLRSRYVDSNIAAACLHLQGKKLALFIDYNLPNGELVNNTEDGVVPTDANTVCIVFHPNNGQLAAHYNVLRVAPQNPQPIVIPAPSFSQAHAASEIGLLPLTPQSPRSSTPQESHSPPSPRRQEN